MGDQDLKVLAVNVLDQFCSKRRGGYGIEVEFMIDTAKHFNKLSCEHSV